MSLWFLGRKKDGRRSLYSFGVHPIHFVVLVFLLFGLFLPLIRFFRDLLQ